MKKRTHIYGLYIAFVVSSPVVPVFAQAHPEKTLELILTDKETNEGIPNAVVHTGGGHYVTSLTGRCVFPADRLTADTLSIQCVGYATRKIAASAFRERQPYRLSMVAHVGQLEEVVVSGRKNVPSLSTVHQELSELDIRRNLGSNLASSLEEVKGVSTIQSGVTVAKPVIHGMYSHRILIVNNGVRQQGQQWGDDHAPEIDMNNAGSVSVIKGAEAVRYGSDALGGVIRLDARALPYARQTVKGSVSALYGTNGRRYALTGFADGSLNALPELAWRVQGTYINGGDRSTADYLLNNTGMREADFSAAAGYRRRNYGVELFYSRYHTRLGVLYTAQGGNVELLKERIAIGQPVEIEPFTRHIDYPYQEVTHQIARAEGFYRFPNRSTLTVGYAYQTDHRDEFHQRRNNLSHIPSLSLDLRASQFDADWKHSYAGHWRTDAGVFHSHTDNANRAGTGVVPVIPNYTQHNAGVFALQKYTRESWGAEAGVRFDYQQMNAAGIDAYSRPYGGKRHFSNVTYNVGGHYAPTENLRLVSHLGMAWRAPHVYELYSNGLDHASGIYMVGKADMKSERSTKWITSVSFDSPSFALSVDGYLQWVDNFIYDEPTQEYMTVISGTYPVFAYRQVGAFFRGVDAELTWNPSARLTYEAGGSMIWVNERHTGRYLPYIPSLRASQSLRYTFSDRGGFRGTYLRARHKYVAKQERFDPASDLIPYSPPAYHLFGLEAGTTFALKRGGKLTFSVDSDNLFNKAYKEYTNRFRYYAHDAGRDVRFMVIWDF